MTVFGKYKGLLYLVGLLIVAPWLAYRAVIADTLRISHELKQAEKEVSRLRTQTQHKRTDQGGVIVGNSVELQSGDLISRIMDSNAGLLCTVVKYTPYITESRDGLNVHTAELILSGGYSALLQLIEKIETGNPSCRIVSVAFKSLKTRSQKQTQLHATLILQQITGT